MRDFISWSFLEISFFEIHASMLCKHTFRVAWWNTSLLTSKSMSQVLQTRVWWTLRLSLETRVLHKKLAFGVLDLENFKSALLSSLDANMTNPVSQTWVWWTLHLGAKTRVLHMKLAFGVLDLENFKFAFLNSLDVNRQALHLRREYG